MARRSADPAPTGPAFTAAVSAITDAFGDPTRRRIYLYTRDAGPTWRGHRRRRGRPRSASTPTSPATTSTSWPPAGTSRSSRRDPLDAGRPPGRPPVEALRRGRAVTEPTFPVRSDDLVLALLGRALDRLPRHEAEAMAEEVGASYGRAMAAGAHRRRPRRRSAVAALGDAGRRRRPHRPRVRRPHGHRHRQRQTANGLRIINDHCPFGDVATDHPVICAVDRGMVRGMLERPVRRRRRRRRRHRGQQGPRRHHLRDRRLAIGRSPSGGGRRTRRCGRSRGGRPWGGRRRRRGLRVVLDHQLGRLGGGAVDEQLDEPQRHVDAARHAGGGDDPAVEVLDDARRRGMPPRTSASTSRALQCVVAVRPSSSPAAARTSEPVHTDVV